MRGGAGQELKPLPNRLRKDTTWIALFQQTGGAIDGTARLDRVNGGGHQAPTFAAGDPEWIKKPGP